MAIQTIERVPAGNARESLRQNNEALTPYRVLLVEDQPLVRIMLGSVLRSYPDIRVVGEAGDGEDAVKLAAHLRPDIVVMDFNLPKLNGVHATRRILASQPAMKVIGISFNVESYVQDAFASAGAVKFVDKHLASEKLYPAIISATKA